MQKPTKNKDLKWDYNHLSERMYHVNHEPDVVEAGKVRQSSRSCKSNKQLSVLIAAIPLVIDFANNLLLN